MIVSLGIEGVHDMVYEIKTLAWSFCDRMTHKNKSNLLSLARGYDMGWKVYLFEDQKSILRLQCGICQHVCYNAVGLSCIIQVDKSSKRNLNNDHDILYCKLCLETYLKENNNKCPINKNHKNVSCNINYSIRKKINNLIIHCPKSKQQMTMNMENDKDIGDLKTNSNSFENDVNNENVDKYYCKWKGKLLNLSNHLKSNCKYGKIKQIPPFIQKQLNTMKMKISEQQDTINTIKSENSFIKQQLTDTNSKLNHLELENSKLWEAINQIKMSQTQYLRNHDTICIVEEEDDYDDEFEDDWFDDDMDNDNDSEMKLESEELLKQTRKRMDANKVSEKKQVQDDEKSESIKDNGIYYHPKDYELYHPKKLRTARLHTAKLYYYECCRGDKESEGCAERFACCHRPYPHSKGCQIRFI